MRPVVLGASGFLGLNIVDAFVANGVAPIALHRRASTPLPLRRRGASPISTDLQDVNRLAGTLAGTDVVVHAAAHYPKTSLDRNASVTRALVELEPVLEACARARVHRLVFLSSTATAAPRSAGPSDENDRFEAMPAFGTYHDVKWALERRLDAEDRFEVVTLCPGACIGPWDLRVGTSVLVVAAARGLLPALPDGVVNVVDARDVGAAVVRVAMHEAPPRRLLLSQASYRLHELLSMLTQRYGTPSPAPPIPTWVAQEVADQAEREAEQTGGRAVPARELIDLIAHGVPVSADLARTSLDLTFRSLAASLDAFDAWARRFGLIPSLTQEMAS